jgi:hypothetical protein
VNSQIKELGRGGFGAAILVAPKTDPTKRYVVKEVSLSAMGTKERADAQKEVDFLRELSHPNIVGFVDSFVEEGGKTLCIVMEYADGGDLTTLIRRVEKDTGGGLDEEEALGLFVQLLLALRHLHDRRIVHRDIKSQNVFLTSRGIVKLGDFGIAAKLAHSAAVARTQIGTPLYLSPEICQERPYGRATDIWSLGCVLYEMLMLRPPFSANNLPALVNKILKGHFARPPATVSTSTRELIDGMLQVDPAKRPSIREMLKHPAVLARMERLQTSLRSREVGQALATTGPLSAREDRSVGPSRAVQMREEALRMKVRADAAADVARRAEAERQKRLALLAKAERERRRAKLEERRKAAEAAHAERREKERKVRHEQLRMWREQEKERQLAIQEALERDPDIAARAAEAERRRAMLAAERDREDQRVRDAVAREAEERRAALRERRAMMAARRSDEGRRDPVERRVQDDRWSAMERRSEPGERSPYEDGGHRDQFAEWRLAHLENQRQVAEVRANLRRQLSADERGAAKLFAEGRRRVVEPTDGVMVDRASEVRAAAAAKREAELRSREAELRRAMVEHGMEVARMRGQPSSSDEAPGVSSDSEFLTTELEQYDADVGASDEGAASRVREQADERRRRAQQEREALLEEARVALVRERKDLRLRMKLRAMGATESDTSTPEQHASVEPSDTVERAPQSDAPSQSDALPMERPPLRNPVAFEVRDDSGPAMSLQEAAARRSRQKSRLGPSHSAGESTTTGLVGLSLVDTPSSSPIVAEAEEAEDAEAEIENEVAHEADACDIEDDLAAAILQANTDDGPLPCEEEEDDLDDWKPLDDGTWGDGPNGTPVTLAEEGATRDVVPHHVREMLRAIMAGQPETPTPPEEPTTSTLHPTKPNTFIPPPAEPSSATAILSQEAGRLRTFLEAQLGPTTTDTAVNAIHAAGADHETALREALSGDALSKALALLPLIQSLSVMIRV